MPIKMIKDWKVPKDGIKLYKKNDEVICVTDFFEEKNYVLNHSYPVFAVCKKVGDIPRFNYERIFSSFRELNSFFENVTGKLLCGI